MSPWILRRHAPKQSISWETSEKGWFSSEPWLMKMCGFQKRQTLLLLKKECNPQNILRSGICCLKYFMWFSPVAIKILVAPANQQVILWLKVLCLHLLFPPILFIERSALFKGHSSSDLDLRIWYRRSHLKLTGFTYSLGPDLTPIEVSVFPLTTMEVGSDH